MKKNLVKSQMHENRNASFRLAQPNEPDQPDPTQTDPKTGQFGLQSGLLSTLGSNISCQDL